MDSNRKQILVDFGIRLRQFRQAKGWTQAQLSKASGLDRSFLSELERGLKNAGLETLAILAASFHIPLSTLLEGVGVRSFSGVN